MAAPFRVRLPLSPRKPRRGSPVPPLCSPQGSLAAGPPPQRGGCPPPHRPRKIKQPRVHVRLYRWRVRAVAVVCRRSVRVLMHHRAAAAAARGGAHVKGRRKRRGGGAGAVGRKRAGSLEGGAERLEGGVHAARHALVKAGAAASGRVASGTAIAGEDGDGGWGGKGGAPGR